MLVPRRGAGGDDPGGTDNYLYTYQVRRQSPIDEIIAWVMILLFVGLYLVIASRAPSDKLEVKEPVDVNVK